MSAISVILLIIAIVAIAAAAWLYMQRDRTRKLRTRFGDEYDRVLEREHGDRRRAEAELAELQRRFQKLLLRALTTEDSE